MRGLHGGEGPVVLTRNPRQFSHLVRPACGFEMGGLGFNEPTMDGRRASAEPSNHALDDAQPSKHALDDASRTQLERSLSAAVASALSVRGPAAVRRAIIARYLLALHDGIDPPSTPVGKLEASSSVNLELARLGSDITVLLNRTRNRAGWPLKALGEALMSGESTAASGRLPQWWPAAQRGVMCSKSEAPPRWSEVPTASLPPGAPRADRGASGHATLPKWWREAAVLTVHQRDGGGARRREALTQPNASAPRMGAHALAGDGGRLPAWWSHAAEPINLTRVHGQRALAACVDG